jgi:hypothetical protein
MKTGKEQQTYIDLCTGELIPEDHRHDYPKWYPVIPQDEYNDTPWNVLEHKYQINRAVKWSLHLDTHRITETGRLSPTTPTKPVIHYFLYCPPHTFTHEERCRIQDDPELSNLPVACNLSELVSILLRIQMDTHEEWDDLWAFHAPSECGRLVTDRYIRRYKYVLTAYGIDGNDLIEHLEERVGNWAYRHGFDIPIEVCPW